MLHQQMMIRETMYLRQAGYQNVSELIGGLKAWKKAKYPIEGWWSMPGEKS